MAVRAVSFLLACLAGACLGDYARTVSYEGEVLVKCSGLKRDAIKHLLETDGVDVWHVGHGGGVDFRVSSEQFQKMKAELPGCSEAMSVEQLVKDEEKKRANRQLDNKTKQDWWFERYHDYSTIVTWYEDLAVGYPDIVKFVPSIGKSLEGRDMPAVHITASSSPRKYYFQCQIHAREWISGATCMYLANYFTENYGKDELVTSLLEATEFIIVPFVNPDGYVYTWTGDRLWRKNRRPGTPCYGVDLNRNYPDHWGGGGSSGNPCSETYRGESAASEPETQNTINYFKSLTDPRNPVYGGIDWHSYGQLILRPYGWTDEDAPDEEQLRQLGARMAEAIYQVNGASYSNEKSIGLYPTTGAADDWMYSDDANEGNGEYRAGVYTIELRDTGFYGFQLPPEYIIPTGEEIAAAVMVYAEALNADPLMKKQQ